MKERIVERCQEKWLFNRIDQSGLLLWCTQVQGHASPHRALADAYLLFPESKESYVTVWWEKAFVA